MERVSVNHIKALSSYSHNINVLYIRSVHRSELEMSRSVLFIFVITLLQCLARQVHFEISNDPDYPKLVAISNVNYQMVMNKYIDVSATVHIYEEINEGTNVSGTVRSKDGKYKCYSNHFFSLFQYL